MAGDARFDAAQYEFFGKSVMDEVELGGLEEDDNESGFVELPDYVTTDQNRQEVVLLFLTLSLYFKPPS